VDFVFEVAARGEISEVRREGGRGPMNARENAIFAVAAAAAASGRIGAVHLALPP
jgi:hypothetical protein